MQLLGTDKKPPRRTGCARILAAFLYSLDGLREASGREAAFRQELCLVALAVAALFFLPVAPLWKGVLFFATAAILVVELLNSAIEAVVDLASPEYHVLAKRAKDFGSAAVLLTLVGAAVLWGAALYSVFREY